MYNQKSWPQHPIDTRQNSIYYYQLSPFYMQLN